MVSKVKRTILEPFRELFSKKREMGTSEKVSKSCPGASGAFVGAPGEAPKKESSPGHKFHNGPLIGPLEWW